MFKLIHEFAIDIVRVCMIDGALFQFTLFSLAGNTDNTVITVIQVIQKNLYYDCNIAFTLTCFVLNDYTMYISLSSSTINFLIALWT